MIKLICFIIMLNFVSFARASEVDNLYKNGSVESGKLFFMVKNNGNNFESCTSCHTTDPKSVGTHAKTGREIKPMAPIVNPDRLSDLAKTEKWFKRNCPDVVGRECSATEKSNVVAYLRSIK